MSPDLTEKNMMRRSKRKSTSVYARKQKSGKTGRENGSTPTTAEPQSAVIENMTQPRP